ncbi:MAG: hypothetical protein ACFB0B_12285 [Thermonemataceae bacterium]
MWSLYPYRSFKQIDASKIWCLLIRQQIGWENEKGCFLEVYVAENSPWAGYDVLHLPPA